MILLNHAFFSFDFFLLRPKSPLRNVICFASICLPSPRPGKFFISSSATVCYSSCAQHIFTHTRYLQSGDCLFYAKSFCLNFSSLSFHFVFASFLHGRNKTHGNDFSTTFITIPPEGTARNALSRFIFFSVHFFYVRFVLIPFVLVLDSPSGIDSKMPNLVNIFLRVSSMEPWPAILESFRHHQFFSFNLNPVMRRRGKIKAPSNKFITAM